MKKKKPSIKDLLSILIGLVLIASIIVYINSRIVIHNDNEAIKEVTYYELMNTIEDNKTKKLTIIESSNGKLSLTIEDKKPSKEKENAQKNTTKDNKEKTTTEIYTSHANPYDSGIADLIKKYDIEYEFITKKNVGSTIFTILWYGFLVFIFLSFLKPTASPKNKGKVRNIPNVSFDDIGGLSEEVKSEILQTQKIILEPERAKKLGIRPSKGILLYGPSGTGKTLIAKAIANNFNAEFISTSGSSFVEMFVGVGAKRARDLFKEAKKHAPSVIFIDEIDAVGKQRAGNNGASSDEREQTLNQILVLLDGVEENSNIFVVAATNRIDILDEALLRPGRFDYKIKIDLPDVEGRKEIIKIHTKNKPLDKEVIENLDSIAESISGYSGADIESLFENAGYTAFAKGRESINMFDINTAIDRIIIGNEGRKIKDKNTKSRVAYHESGHAVASALLYPGNIRKATIIPRGNALGYVAHVPKETLLTKLDLINQAKIMVAGGVGEYIMYGNHSSGVSDDFKKAKELIEKMVHDWGMGSSDLIPTFSNNDKYKEMENLYKKILEETIELLTVNKVFFEEVANLLYNKETIDGSEIEEIKQRIQTDNI